ncbi:hypothetical protein ACFL7M_07965 [Thermodesulfobacteriota bacterium]
MSKRHPILMLVLFMLILHFLSCSSIHVSDRSDLDVTLYYNHDNPETTWPLDIMSFEKIAKGIGLTSKRVDYRFINNNESFFNKDDQRKFEVLLIPGSVPKGLFGQRFDRAINCEGVNNILAFIRSGGSVIGLCWIGSALFSSDAERLQSSMQEAQKGLWDKTHSGRGYFLSLCGSYAFNGVIRGPQDTNRPYPKSRFLPIKMNPDNELVKESNLQSVIYQTVVGGGSIIAAKGQPLDIVGWYPNGTVAIGIVPYGKGHIIMSNPHPNITGKAAEIWLNHSWEIHARQMLWTEGMISREKKILKDMIDPDGPDPDWTLAKAMLQYAYRKALK